MRYLPRSCTEADLRAKFERCGRIKRTWLSVDRASGECKGFGFVTFSSKTEARRCVKDYNEHPRNYMDGKHVVITHAKGWDDGRQPVAPCSFGSACRQRIAASRTPKTGTRTRRRRRRARRRRIHARAPTSMSFRTARTARQTRSENARVDDEPHPHEGGRASDKKPREYKQRKKTASRRHKLGAKARKRAKAREAKEAAG